MPVQAIPLALISALYPLGLAAVLLLTKAVHPRAKEAVFLIGAALTTLTVGFVIVLARHGASSSQSSSNNSSSYWLQLAAGVFFLAAAAVLARRPPKQHKKSGPSRITRAAREGGLAAVFLAGLLLYLPSPTYLAALDDIGKAKLSTTAAIAWVVLVAAIVLITVEVPVLLFLFAPEKTVPRLRAVTDWLDRNERRVLVVLLALLGLWGFIQGLAGLL